MESKIKQLPWTKIIIIVLFALTLTGLRLIWINNFSDPEQEKGVKTVHN